MSLDSVIIGENAEEVFREWMDRMAIPYFRIDQDRERYSYSLLTVFGAKRPDFIVLLPRFGLMFIDVKGRRSFKDCFAIHKEGIDKYTQLEEHFNFKLWFTFYDEHLDNHAFYWINLHETVKQMWEDKVFNGNKFMHTVYQIPIKACTRIGFEESKETFIPKILHFSP